MTIYHFVRLDEWLLAQERNRYEPSSLTTDGFIHCCTEAQINDLAQRLWDGHQDWLLLEINEDAAKAPVIYEDLYELNLLYPHLYGALNQDAVKGIYYVESVVDDHVGLKLYDPCKSGFQK